MMFKPVIMKKKNIRACMMICLNNIISLNNYLKKRKKKKLKLKKFKNYLSKSMKT